jgi:cobalt-zinc-cadmium efflux system protein
MTQEPRAAHAGHDHSHEHDHAGHGHEHDGHDHGHGGHSHAPTVTAGNERVVLIGFALTFSFMIAEVIGGLLSGSLALIADAGHMLTDAFALALAWAGFRFGRRPSDRKRTFGYMRLEVLAGFVNAVSLFALVAWIAWEAVGRLLEPHPILTGPMFVVAVLGLLVNIVVFFVLRQGDTEHVNIKGAMLHVVGDLLGSVAAIVAAIAIYFTGWTPIDPILSVLLSLLILRSAWALFKNSLQILIEGAPSGIDVEGMPEALAASVPGVAGVDHIHVWSITSGQPAATMEVRLTPGADPRETLRAVKAALADTYGIGHSTIEIDFGDTPADCSLGAIKAGKKEHAP